MTNLELRFQQDAFRSVLEPLDPLNKQTSGRRSQLIAGLVDRRECRAGVLAKLQIVEAHKRNILRASQIEFVHGMKDTKRHQIIAGKDRSRAGQHSQKPLSGQKTTACIEGRFLNELRGNPQTRFP